MPVLLRMTTRVCHSKTVVRPRPPAAPPDRPHFERDMPRPRDDSGLRPAGPSPAARRSWPRSPPGTRPSGLNRIIDGSRELGIITSGIAFMHAREAAPEASVLKLGMTYPLPLETIRALRRERRALRGDRGRRSRTWSSDPRRGHRGRRQAGDVPLRRTERGRVRRILAGDTSPEAAPPPGKPPQLCAGLPAPRRSSRRCASSTASWRATSAATRWACCRRSRRWTRCVCMGASIGVGLGLRHVLPPEQARRVVSVIGDSTFVHSGITGLVEMVYNPPPTGHVVLILDNGTTAMTGLQEHPGTGPHAGPRADRQGRLRGPGAGAGHRAACTWSTRARTRTSSSSCCDECLASGELTRDHRPPALPAGRQADQANTSRQPTGRAARRADHDERASPTSSSPAWAARACSRPRTSWPRRPSAPGCDVKKSEVHGMSQRGGSVTSDVRFGAQVFSPMVPAGRGGFPGGAGRRPGRAQPAAAAAGRRADRARTLIDASRAGQPEEPERGAAGRAQRAPGHPRSSTGWTPSARTCPPKLHEANLQAFAVGREPAASNGRQRMIEP